MKERSLNGLLEAGIRNNWDNPALSNYDGRTLLYKDVAEMIVKLQMTFERCGLKKGDKVAVCSRNQANWGVAFLAALSYGAIPVPVLHEFKPGNIHYLVNHSEAKLLFVGFNIWENLSAAEMPALKAIITLDNFRVIHAVDGELAKSLVDVDRLFAIRYQAGFTPEDLKFYREDLHEVALINYTSGTSGFAKGVMIPYSSLLLNVEYVMEVDDFLGSRSDIVAMLPSAHMYGLLMELIVEVAVGAHVHFLTRLPSPQVIFESFARIKPDFVIAVPLIMEKVSRNVMRAIGYDFDPSHLTEEDKRRAEDMLNGYFGRKFNHVVIGGAALNSEVEDFLNAVGFRYTVGYGMTECGPIISYNYWDQTKIHTCGKVAHYNEVRIDSEDPEHVPGEVYVRGDNVFLGYYKMPKETAEVLGSDGWFRTGDVGTLDKDGYLALKGRSKSMILTPNGQNIYPEEIESSINNLPYVTESLVVVDKNVLVALIYPDNALKDENGLSDEQLEQTLNEEVCRLNGELPNYCRIAKVELFPEEFEKTPKKSIKRYLYQR